VPSFLNCLPLVLKHRFDPNLNLYRNPDTITLSQVATCILLTFLLEPSTDPAYICLRSDRHTEVRQPTSAENDRQRVDFLYHPSSHQLYLLVSEDLDSVDSEKHLQSTQFTKHSSFARCHQIQQFRYWSFDHRALVALVYILWRSKPLARLVRLPSRPYYSRNHLQR